MPEVVLGAVIDDLVHHVGKAVVVSEFIENRPKEVPVPTEAAQVPGSKGILQQFADAGEVILITVVTHGSALLGARSDRRAGVSFGSGTAVIIA
jgi:hypothetical protein